MIGLPDYLYVKGVAHSDEPKDSYLQLCSSPQLYRTF